MRLNFATVVACGGIGQRMNADKASLRLAGVTLADRAIVQAQSFGGPVALSVRPGQRLASHDLPELTDETENLGPISALESGFRFASDNGRSHLLMIGCDQPFLPLDLAERLCAAIGDHGVAVPFSGGHGQYMAALWKVDPTGLQAYVARGGRALWRYAEAIGMATVPWPDDNGRGPFADIDDPAALAEAERRIRDEAR